MMNWFRRKKKSEISYVFKYPDDESPNFFIQAISSLNKKKFAECKCVWFFEEKRMFIGDLKVDEDYRNQGIGSYILKEIIRISKELGATEVYGELSSVDDVERLYYFYKERGFRVTECEYKNSNTVAIISYDLAEKIDTINI